MKTPNRTNSLAFRLTLLYALMFFLSSAIVFILCYFLASSYLLNQIDRRLSAYWRNLNHGLETNTLDSLDEELTDLATARGTERVFFYVLDHNGRLVASSDLSSWAELSLNEAFIAKATKGLQAVATVYVPDRHLRLRVLAAPIFRQQILLAGISLAEYDAFLNRMIEVFISMVLVTILLGMIVGWHMARRAMSGVEEVAAVATDIAQGHFDQRVSVTGQGEEIAQLASAFNAMLEKISHFITGMKEINDNIAHDLRTPITRIRGMAETTLIADESLDEYQALAGSIIEECDRLLSMINTILDISEAEAGLTEIKRKDLDLAALVRQGVSLFQPLGEDKGVIIQLQTPETCPFRGDVNLLQRLMANLLDNAVKFTPAGGHILVKLHTGVDLLELQVADNGPGIPETDLAHIFERFYRGDRSRSTPGFGLGLALARSIARSHQGDILVTSQPGQGSIFKVQLPLVSPSHK